MPHLDVIEGPEPGLQVTLNDEITIGRSPDNIFCLPDGRASRRHARLQPRDDRFIIEDMGSANGTFLNGTRINPGVPHELRDGDEIAIGSSRLLYCDERQQRRKAAPTSGLAAVVGDDKVGAPAVNATLDASLSMLEVLEEEKKSEKGLMEAVKRLQAMVRVSAELGTVTSLNGLLERIMGSIFEIFPVADRAFILLRDKKSGEMVPAFGRTRETAPGQKEEFPISRTILTTVTEKKQAVLCSDAQEDFGSQRSIVDLSIRSVMCAPFIVQDELLGVINVDTTTGMKTFSTEDLPMLCGIAAQAAIAIKNAELYEAVEDETKKRSQLSRYLSPDVVDGVLDGTIPLELGGEKKRGTVFFCDIVGFTAMSEKLTAMEVIDKLNRYFSITTEVVTRNKGTLHKFGGDMIMAFWNVLMVDPSAEINAIKTSLEMQTAVWSFDLDLLAEGQTPIYLGIGCNTGEFAGGNIGGENSMEYTIIGDNVNLGQRIESMAGRWQVFVSEETYNAAREICSAVQLPPVKVKGKQEPISIYSIRGIQTAPDCLTMDIPVHVKSPDGTALGEGMLTRCKDSEGLHLSLSTTAALEASSQVVIDFDTPELGPECTITAVVSAAQRGQHEIKTEYTKAVLGDLQATPEVLGFLRPGALIMSPKTWEQMARH